MYHRAIGKPRKCTSSLPDLHIPARGGTGPRSGGQAGRVRIELLGWPSDKSVHSPSPPSVSILKSDANYEAAKYEYRHHRASQSVRLSKQEYKRLN